MSNQLEHRKIDPTECPRCHGHNTEWLGDDGTPTGTYLCRHCEESYDVARVQDIMSITWDDKDGQTHTLYDTNYMVRQAAQDLLAVLRRLARAAGNRENTMGDPCRLIECQTELRAATKAAIATIDKIGIKDDSEPRGNEEEKGVTP